MPGFKPFFSRQSQKIATGNDDGHSGQQDEANVSEGYKTRRIINHKRALSGYYPEKERPVSKTRKLGQFVFRGGLDKKSMLQSISDPNVAKYTHEMRPDVDRPCLDAPQDPSSFNSHLLAENSQVDSAAEDDLTMAAPTKIDKSGPRDNNGSDELSTVSKFELYKCGRTDIVDLSPRQSSFNQTVCGKTAPSLPIDSRLNTQREASEFSRDSLSYSRSTPNLIGIQSTLDGCGGNAFSLSFVLNSLIIGHSNARFFIRRANSNLNVFQLTYCCWQVLGTGKSQSRTQHRRSNSAKENAGTVTRQRQRRKIGSQKQPRDDGQPIVGHRKKKKPLSEDRHFACPVKQVHKYFKGEFNIEEADIANSCGHFPRKSAYLVKNHILRTHSYLFRIEVVQDLRGWSRKRPSESEEELVVEIYCLLFNRHKPDLPELYMVPELYMTEPMLGSHSSWEPQEAQNTWLQAQILEKTGQRQSEIPNMEYPEHLRLAREYRHYCEVNRQGDPTTGVLEFLLREAIQISPRMNQEYPQIELARAKHANEMAQQFSQLHRQHPTQSPTLLFLWMNIYLWLRRNFYLTGPPSDPVGHSNHLSMSSASNSDYYPATVASSTQPTSVSPGPNVSRESDAFPHADPMSMDSVPPERSVEDITDLVQRLESQANSSTTEGPAVASTSMKREPFDDSPEITLDSPVANEQKEILDYEMSLAGL